MATRQTGSRKVPTTVLLTPEIRAIIEQLATDNDRSLGYMIDTLMAEALKARGLLKD